MTMAPIVKSLLIQLVMDRRSILLNLFTWLIIFVFALILLFGIALSLFLFFKFAFFLHTKCGREYAFLLTFSIGRRAACWTKFKIRSCLKSADLPAGVQSGFYQHNSASPMMI